MSWRIVTSTANIFLSVCDCIAIVNCVKYYERTGNSSAEVIASVLEPAPNCVTCAEVSFESQYSRTALYTNPYCS